MHKSNQIIEEIAEARLEIGEQLIEKLNEGYYTTH